MPHAALRELIGITGLPEPGTGRVTITGEEPYLRTRYRVGATGAAAQAAVGAGISELWKLHTGREQQIAIDLRAASYALRGNQHLYINGVHDKELDPWFTFYPVRDGRWIRVHANFPHHRDAALKLWGWPADIEAAMKVTAGWDGLALEDAIHAAGGVAALIRTPEEWAAHPQSAAVATRPLLEIRRIGDSPAEPASRGDRPLSGIRMLDLTRVLAGPTCSRTLASYGADVLKIHPAHVPGAHQQELETGFGKLSTTLDLRSQEGTDTMRGLLREADVFSQGYRPGSLAARGFSPEDAARLRPGIIYVELSAWDIEGPWKHRRGFDTLVCAARGWSLAQGDGTKPGHMPVSANDYIAGYLMALGVITALRRRALEGGSWHIRTSLARVAQWIESHGTIDLAKVAALPAAPSDSDIDALSFDTESPLGRIRCLRPALKLSETPPYWARPPVPVGYHQPVWPDRKDVRA